MSLFGSIKSIFKGAASGFLTGGPVGAVIGGAAGAAGGFGGGGARPPTTYAGMGGMPRMPGGGLGGMRTLPGAGTFRIPPINIRKALPRLGKAAVAGASAKYVYDAFGNLVPARRRRRKGITASELKGFKRVACILRDYQKVATKTHVKAPARRGRVCA